MPLLAAKIQSIQIPEVDREDMLIWKPSATGKLTMKAAFEYYREKEEEMTWLKLIWKRFLPPKISVFIWRLLWHKLPTEDNLRKRGMVLTSCCSNCAQPSMEETTQHVLWECDFARELWVWLGQTLHFNILQYADLRSLIHGVTHRPKKKLQNQVLQAFSFFIIWEIWKVRNSRKFESKNTTVSQCKKRVRSLLTRVSFLFDGEEGNDAAFMTTLRTLNIKGKFTAPKDPMEVRWIPPPPTWHKVNFDGAAQGQPGIAACGGIVRNYRGFVRGTFAAPLGIQTSMFAEIMGFLWAVKICRQKGWFPLWIESDSMVVVTKVQNKSMEVPWQLRTEWENCIQFLEGQQYRISHIFREGNAVADAMANEGLSLVDFTWWYGVPSIAGSFYTRNLCSQIEYRF